LTSRVALTTLVTLPCDRVMYPLYVEESVVNCRYRFLASFWRIIPSLAVSRHFVHTCMASHAVYVIKVASAAACDWRMSTSAAVVVMSPRIGEKMSHLRRSLQLITIYSDINHKKIL